MHSPVISVILTLKINADVLLVEYLRNFDHTRGRVKEE